MAAFRHADACSRVVAHFDVDCFYAQSEVLRRPSLRGRPVGITQKFLVVTCNYIARALGVPKMASIEEARRRCPDLVLINGEDLTPYRAASKRIMALLGRFGTVERLGLDEGAVDITAEVKARVASGAIQHGFSGFLIDSCYTASTKVSSSGASESREFSEKKDVHGEDTEITMHIQEGFAITDGNKLLMVGSQLVTEIRTALEKETGFQVSCGVAHNKMLAKMACSVNKPNKQTILLDSATSKFLLPMSVRKLPGVGHKMEASLRDINVETVADLQKVTTEQLSSLFGERTGVFLYHACRGYDPKPVHNKGPPKSLSVEDSFRNCTTLKQVEAIMRSLAPDLVRRVDEDKEEFQRVPKLLTVKWRTKAIMPFTSVSGPMPADLLSTTLAMNQRSETAVEAGMRLVSRYFGAKPFHMVVLNIGATGFTETSGGTSPAGDIRVFLQTPRKSSLTDPNLEKESINLGVQGQEGLREVGGGGGGGGGGPDKDLSVLQLQKALVSSSKVVSKYEARIQREGSFLKEAAPSWKCESTGFGEEGQDEFASDLSERSDDNEGDDNLLEESSVHPGWKGGSSHGTETGEFIELENKSHPREAVDVATPDLQGDSLNTGSNCKWCGQLVEQSEQAQQEHEDYHFALSLQEDSRGSNSMKVVTGESSYGTPKSREKPRTYISPSSKRPKSRNGTLDSFILRR